MTSLEKRIAKDNFYRFCQLDGCDHIASEYALVTILKLCKRYKIRSILEIGLGIGCIADTVQQYYSEAGKDIYYCGTEPNEFCLNAIQKNIVDIENIQVHKSLNDINNNRKFDLLIVDGGDKSLQSLKKLMNKTALIYVEGYRSSQIGAMKRIFPKVLHTEVISIEKNKEFSPFIQSHWMGGGQLLFVNPNWNQKVYWFIEKVKTKIKYKLRKVI